MNAPTFTLPPCPTCSNRIPSERPFWRYCHNTSRARGHGCFIFAGCSHANEIGKFRIFDDGSKWSEIEGQWVEKTQQLLATKSALWKESERAAFSRKIEDNHFIPGAIEELALEEVGPAPKKIAVTAKPPRAAFVMDSERDF